MAKAAGWYPDPTNQDSLKYWDGNSWTSGLFDDALGVTRGKPLDAKEFLDEIDPPARVPLNGKPTSGEAGPDAQTAGMMTRDLFEDDRSVAVAERPGAVDADRRPPVATAALLDDEPKSESAHEAPESDPIETPERRWGVIIAIATAVLIAIVLLGLALWLVLDSSSEIASDTATTAATDDETGEQVPATEDPQSPDSGPTSNDDSAAEPAQDEESSADPPADESADSPLITTQSVTVVVDGAPVHADPSLDSPEVGSLAASDSPSVEVVGQPTQGWYFVLDNDGWVFGAYITPQADGYIAARTVDGEPAVLLDQAGDPTGVANPTGSHLLLFGDSEPLWPVILPDGSFAFVDGATVEPVDG